MTQTRKLLSFLSPHILYETIKSCAILPGVRNEVIKNHDNNQWWPLTVRDWRLRMVLAGWSTRVSYNMISTYRQVVSNANNVGYEQLCEMSEEKLYELVGPLGLFGTRLKYLKSLKLLITELQGRDLTPSAMANEDLIKTIAENVEGASYKVAQCASLYAKGYHCGIFPVDSGMKDMLGPCLGLQLPRSAISHEIMRKHIETLLNASALEYYELSQETGFENLAIPRNQAPIWWAHLVVIYFKRLYCNKHTPESCPLRAHSSIGRYLGTMCDRQVSSQGGYRCVILEGVDQVGKTTVSTEMKKMGYSVIHSPFNPDHKNIYQHYRTLIDDATTPTVFDRSFISEMVYGYALRGYSRLTETDFRRLLEALARNGCIILYMEEPRNVIIERLKDNSKDHFDVVANLEKLLDEYERWISKATELVPVYRIRPTEVSKTQIVSRIMAVIESG